MNIDSDTKRFIIYRLKWLGLYFGIGLILVLLLPFPYDFFSVLALFILINFLRGRSILRRYGGTGGIKDLFGSFSSSMLRGLFSIHFAGLKHKYDTVEVVEIVEV